MKKQEEEKEKENSDVFKGKLKGLEQFQDFKSLFGDLTKRHFIDTKKLDCIQIIISQDSKYAVCLLANN